MMLSRMAEALYWMARYLERVDNVARLMEINLLHLVETQEAGLDGDQWQPYLDISGSGPLFQELRGSTPISKETAVPFFTQENANLMPF